MYGTCPTTKSSFRTSTALLSLALVGSGFTRKDSPIVVASFPGRSFPVFNYWRGRKRQREKSGLGTRLLLLVSSLPCMHGTPSVNDYYSVCHLYLCLYIQPLVYPMIEWEIWEKNSEIRPTSLQRPKGPSRAWPLFGGFTVYVFKVIIIIVVVKYCVNYSCSC